jgi:hypothetical protein
VAAFRLEKWYFDCVGPGGDAFVGYAARLAFGLVGLSYGARLAWRSAGPALQRQSLSFGTVTARVGAVRWTNARLGVVAEWTEGRPIPPILVVDEPSGRIVWQCLGADCLADVTAGGRHLSGTGYAERLTMTIPPWALPFEELRWGRFIADDRSAFVVWIDLKGDSRRTWIWAGSAEPVAGSVDDDGIRTDAAELVFLTSESLRRDDVARTLLGRFRPLERLLPKGARGIREEKRVGRCLLKMKDSESRGYSIDEVVTWSRG